MPNVTGPLGGLLQYMNYLQKGLAVHTDNLSRLDIPNAQAKELKPFAEQVNKASSARLAMTNASHMTSKLSGSTGFAVQKSQSDHGTLSGNTIDREDEMSKVNHLTTEYQKATRIYQKGLSMMRTILGAKG